MKFSQLIAAILIFAVLVLIFSSAYVVSEQEQVLITRFGQPVGVAVTTAGLHFKTPFVEDVNTFEKRIIQWDGPASEMTTKDKLFIVVDTFARWRITDPLLYFQNLRDERSAQSRLDSLLGSEVRNVVARHDLIEVVRTDKNRQPVPDDSKLAAKISELRSIQFGRELLEKEIFKAAAPTMKPLGIELLDLRFKRINYKSSVIEKIYLRMTSERDQIAQGFLSDGAGEAAKIMGRKEKDLKEIDSTAYKSVQEIQGKADATATEIYAQAYNTSPSASDFYQFMKTLDTYKIILSRDTTLVLTTDSDLFKFLKRIDGGTTPKKPVVKPAPGIAPAPAAPAAPAPASVPQK